MYAIDPYLQYRSYQPRQTIVACTRYVYSLPIVACMILHYVISIYMTDKYAIIVRANVFLR